MDRVKSCKFNHYNWSGLKPIAVLVLTVLLLIGLFVGIFIFSHEHELPIDKAELSIIMPLSGGFICCMISAAVMIYMAYLQQKMQNRFFENHEESERKRLFLQFYVNELNRFEEKQRAWIEISDTFIKKSENYTEEELKYGFRLLRDAIIVINRYRHTFTEEVLKEKWSRLEDYTHNFEKWLFDKYGAMVKGEKIKDIGREYHGKFYKEMTYLLAEISDAVLMQQEKRIEELRSL